jgi:hypothetical protein
VGLKTNLGLLLSNTQASPTPAANASRTCRLLPSIDFNAKTGLCAERSGRAGLEDSRFSHHHRAVRLQDVRANLTWKVVNLNSLKTYMASRHYFRPRSFPPRMRGRWSS